jgi:Ger(x)C family germination protein
MNRKIIIFALILFIPLCTAGCFNYRDINRSVFVTAMLIDIDSFNNSILYVETFMPTRGDQVEIGEERKTIFKVKGNSLFEAARNLSLMSNYRFSYSQCRAVIFTQSAAKYGLDNFLDMFDRSQSLPLRSYAFITTEDVEKIMNAKMNEEQYIGVFLSELAQNADVSSKGTVLRIDEFFNNRVLGSKVNLVNVVELAKDQKEPRLQIVGLAVIKDDKLMDMLNPEQSMAYNFLINKFKNGTINITNPENPDRLATIEILKNKTKSSLKYDGGSIQLKRTINSKGNLSFSEKSIHVTNDEERNVLIKNSEEYIKRICTKLFDDYKEKDVDIFNLQRELQKKYPRLKINDYLKITELDIDVNVDINGSAQTTNFE